jgi:hypothetical protein
MIEYPIWVKTKPNDITKIFAEKHNEDEIFFNKSNLKFFRYYFMKTIYSEGFFISNIYFFVFNITRPLLTTAKKFCHLYKILIVIIERWVWNSTHDS